SHTPEGFDVSSSQAQILAIFLGHDELEARASDPAVPFKRYLARLAWKQCAPAGYTGDDDTRLVALVKDLWMRVLYGSSPRQVMHAVLRDPDTYGPGWVPRTSDYAADLQVNVERTEAFLQGVPGFMGERAVSTFLNACQRLAAHVDRYD